MTIQDILAIKYSGNFRDDSAKFDLVDRFINDPSTSIEDAIKASNDCNLRGMGERVQTTAQDIIDMRRC